LVQNFWPSFATSPHLEQTSTAAPR
jgi:hypothetical protein